MKTTLFVAVLVLLLSPILAKAQTTATTNCSTYGSQTNCTTTANTPPTPPRDPWAKFREQQAQAQANRVALKQVQTNCVTGGGVWAGGAVGCLSQEQYAERLAAKQARNEQKAAAKDAKEQQKQAENNYKECVSVDKHDAALQQTCADRYPH